MIWEMCILFKKVCKWADWWLKDDGTVLMAAEDNSESGITTGALTSVSAPSVAGSTTDTRRSSRVHSVDTLRGYFNMCCVLVA